MVIGANTAEIQAKCHAGNSCLWEQGHWANVARKMEQGRPVNYGVRTHAAW